ncbi:G-protein coupled receptor [Biomphalaria pfeifferi]|uniref:G-protein coupled receptor n=1 Tax=Biomphalaria pfeifferi TaxID=112525 RepID=A0AAD8F429_BIOPF|nr:G-protein coupled receptor [Biomphalaria pfeifferi]
MTSYFIEDSTLINVFTNVTLPWIPPEMKQKEDLSCAQNRSDEHITFYENARFVTGLIVYPIGCIIGITGNILALIVFNHRDMRTSTNVYLSSLAVSDTIKLLNDAMYFMIVAVGMNDASLSQTMMSSLYPVAHYVFNMAVCVTAWLTVSVAVERYISVCYPSRAKDLCTTRRARLVCTFVFLSMSIFAVPSALRYEMRTIFDKALNVTCALIVATDLGNNNQFMIPYSWINNSLRGIIPVFILVFLNVNIINELRKERVKGKKFTARNRITLMLIVIIFMFLICITPDAILSTFFNKGYVDEENLFKGIREITDSLLVVNSALSFMVYCAMSSVFRVTFAKIFFKFRARPPHPEAMHLNRRSPSQKHTPTVESPDVVRANGSSKHEIHSNGGEEYL